jgi:hypothetical protein
MCNECKICVHMAEYHKKNWCDINKVMVEESFSCDYFESLEL